MKQNETDRDGMEWNGTELNGMERNRTKWNENRYFIFLYSWVKSIL